MRTERIETIRKRFRNEWLLIKVAKVKHSKPVNGCLIDHNPDRAIIYKEIAKYNSKNPVYVIYSQDNLPEGYAAAFISNV